MHKARPGMLMTWLVLVTVLSASPSGAQEVLWSKAVFGDGDYFHEPSDIEFDPARSLIYVVDAGSSRVLVFDLDGRFIRAIGRKGQGPGEFSRPTGACPLTGGGMAVADFGNGRIQLFDAAGAFVRAIKVTEVRVADLIWVEDRLFTVPSFGSSGYSITMGSDAKSQPLVNVLDEQGQRVAEMSAPDFPETHPFIRAIKHRVSLALSPRKRLFLPHFAMNLIQVFETTGRKVRDFDRPLPFKPMTPVLIGERSPEEGVVQMRADLDFVNLSAKFGPDGRLYVLTVAEALADIRKDNPDLKDPLPMRIDVIDPETCQAVRTLACDAGIKAFGVLTENRFVYVYEDAEGELALKCVRY